MCLQETHLRLLKTPRYFSSRLSLVSPVSGTGRQTKILLLTVLTAQLTLLNVPFADATLHYGWLISSKQFSKNTRTRSIFSSENNKQSYSVPVEFSSFQTLCANRNQSSQHLSGIFYKWGTKHRSMLFRQVCSSECSPLWVLHIRH